jgi:hypothetical protein
MIERRIVHMPSCLSVLFQPRGGHVRLRVSAVLRRQHGYCVDWCVGLILRRTRLPLVPLLHLGGCVHWKHSPSRGESIYSATTILSPSKICGKFGMNPNPLFVYASFHISSCPPHHVHPHRKSHLTKDLQGLSLQQTLIMHFHILFPDFAQSSGARAVEERVR